MSMLPTSLENVRQAALGLSGIVHRTPVLTSTRINEAVGGEVFFKCENMQRAGAFKLRGAFTAVKRIVESGECAGVLAYSSGNHAQATALSAKLLGVPAVIMMPHDAPESKVSATVGYGAEVIRYNRHTTDREAMAAEISEKRGLTLVPPYDDPAVIAGQGTAALELIEEVGHLDAVVASLGGGGLLSGTAVATRGLLPDAAIFGIEPEAGNDGQQSLKEGRVIRIAAPDALPEGALATHVGALNFDVIKRLVTAIETVTDAEIVRAIQTFAATMKIVVEPTGAMPLAALLAGRIDAKGKRIGVIVSGGNIDLPRLADLISRDVILTEAAE